MGVVAIRRFCVVAMFCLLVCGASGCSAIAVMGHSPPPIEGDTTSMHEHCPSYVWGIADGVIAATAATWAGWNVRRLVDGNDGPGARRGAVSQLLISGTLTTMYGFSSFFGLKYAAGCRARGETGSSAVVELHPPPRPAPALHAR